MLIIVQYHDCFDIFCTPSVGDHSSVLWYFSKIIQHIQIYPLVIQHNDVQKTHTTQFIIYITSMFFHWNWWISILMLVYQRVIRNQNNKAAQLGGVSSLPTSPAILLRARKTNSRTLWLSGWLPAQLKRKKGWTQPEPIWKITALQQTCLSPIMRT